MCREVSSKLEETDGALQDSKPHLSINELIEHKTIMRGTMWAQWRAGEGRGRERDHHFSEDISSPPPACPQAAAPLSTLFSWHTRLELAKQRFTGEDPCWKMPKTNARDTKGL